MSVPRSAFLAGAAHAVDWLNDPAIARRWNDPSSLAGMRISGLAGHLSRAVTLVDEMLESAPPPGDGETVDAVDYFLALPDLLDPESTLNADIRLRGEETAAVGASDLGAGLADVMARLGRRLGDEPEDRLVARNDVVMLLDEYLRTRVVELAVHLDDLAVSVGLDPSTIPAETIDTANDVMFAIAVGRIGPAAALRALARRERSSRALIAF